MRVKRVPHVDRLHVDRILAIVAFVAFIAFVAIVSMVASQVIVRRGPIAIAIARLLTAKSIL